MEIDRLYDKIGNYAEPEDLSVLSVYEQNQSPVYTTMRDHLHIWEREGATNFQTGIIRDGLRLKLSAVPSFYEEKNNASFLEEQEFGIEAINKLLSNGIIREVDRSYLACINPLTVAHRKGKKRLCIDLSRCINLRNTSLKFKIESARQFAEVVSEGDFMWCFDLKSAYHQMPIAEEHWKFLGFSATMEGKKRYFHFIMMPFGLNNATFVLTKMLKFPLKR